MKKCNHKWVDMEDGTLDKFCVRCSKKAKQGLLKMSGQTSMAKPLTQPLARKKREVPFYNGSEHTRVKVYEDELIKSLQESLNLPGININSR